MNKESKIFSLKGTNKTPYIHYDGTTGIFEMNGLSISQDAYEYYNPLLAWLDNYLESPAAKTILQIQLEYFNTSSSKFIFEIILKLDKLSKSGKGLVEINWIHEEDDDGMIDAGESFKTNVSVPFNLISFTE